MVAWKVVIFWFHFQGNLIYKQSKVSIASYNATVHVYLLFNIKLIILLVYKDLIIFFYFLCCQFWNCMQFYVAFCFFVVYVYLLRAHAQFEQPKPETSSLLQSSFISFCFNKTKLEVKEIFNILLILFDFKKLKLCYLLVIMEYKQSHTSEKLKDEHVFIYT